MTLIRRKLEPGLSTFMHMLYYNCVKFYQYQLNLHIQEIWTDGWTRG